MYVCIKFNWWWENSITCHVTLSIISSESCQKVFTYSIMKELGYEKLTQIRFIIYDILSGSGNYKYTKRTHCKCDSTIHLTSWSLQCPLDKTTNRVWRRPKSTFMNPLLQSPVTLSRSLTTHQIYIRHSVSIRPRIHSNVYSEKHSTRRLFLVSFPVKFSDHQQTKRCSGPLTALRCSCLSLTNWSNYCTRRR